jgi:hypothetical protein
VQALHRAALFQRVTREYYVRFHFEARTRLVDHEIILFTGRYSGLRGLARHYRPIMLLALSRNCRIAERPLSAARDVNIQEDFTTRRSNGVQDELATDRPMFLSAGLTNSLNN